MRNPPSGCPCQLLHFDGLEDEESGDLVMPGGSSRRDAQTGAMRGRGGRSVLRRRRPPDTITLRTAAPADRGEPHQFAALTAREDEVAPRANPLRAIAIRPQVALPARRALLTSASLADAHLPTVTRHPAVPMVTRPADRHMPTPGWFSRSSVSTATLGRSARA